MPPSSDEWIKYSDLMREAAENPYDDRPYRRGFQQGYSRALDDVARAMAQMGYQDAMRSLDAFCDQAITRWRITEDENKMPVPPNYSPERWPVESKKDPE